ncbi:protein of unknown function [Burkholderia multivorans]
MRTILRNTAQQAGVTLLHILWLAQHNLPTGYESIYQK